MSSTLVFLFLAVVTALISQWALHDMRRESRRKR